MILHFINLRLELFYLKQVLFSTFQKKLLKTSKTVWSFATYGPQDQGVKTQYTQTFIRSHLKQASVDILLKILLRAVTQKGLGGLLLDFTSSSCMNVIQVVQAVELMRHFKRIHSLLLQCVNIAHRARLVYGPNWPCGPSGSSGPTRPSGPIGPIGLAKKNRLP